MKYTENAINFTWAQETLIGVLVKPHSNPTTGVIVVVGGPQYRAGSHRQFVLLTRALAQEGIASMRFDYRGMGDSTGAAREFSDLSPDIGAAIDAMQQAVPSITRVVLWGLCDGASAALLYCYDTNDQRVRGLCLLNPWVRSEASLARAHIKHYYGQRLRQKEFWIKLFNGKVAGAALAGLWRNIRLMGPSSRSPDDAQHLPFQLRMAHAWIGFQGSVLLLLSGDDYTAKEFLEYAGVDRSWAGLLEQEHIVRHELADADHTFSSPESRVRVESLTLEWLDKYVAG